MYVYVCMYVYAHAVYVDYMWTDDAGFESRQGKEIFLFPKRSDRLRGPPSLLFTGYRCPFLGIKQSRREDYHSFDLVPRLRINGAILSPYMTSWRG
jgi:hypothetical protein